MKKLSIDEPFEIDGRVMVFVKNNGKLTLSVNPEVKKKRKIKEFVPPSIEEVKNYFKQEGYREDVAIRAYNHYHKGEWKDANGKQVKNWKQKMYTNWMREENKIVQPKLNDDSQKINFFQDGR